MAAKPKPWELQEDWYAGLARRVLAEMSAQNLTISRISHLSGVQYTLTARYMLDK